MDRTVCEDLAVTTASGPEPLVVDFLHTGPAAEDLEEHGTVSENLYLEICKIV